MNYLFLDTETTGFQPGQIAQLSYIVTDEQLAFKKAVNHFFMVDDMPKQASDVHGFTLERLKELSKGNVFKNVSNEVHKDLQDNKLVIHNSDFDMRFLRAEMKRCNVEVSPKDIFCTMKHFTPICKLPGKRGYKWPKLAELMEYLKIEPEIALTVAKEFYGSGDIGFHDARFDTAGLFLCYRRALMGKYL